MLYALLDKGHLMAIKQFQASNQSKREKKKHVQYVLIINYHHYIVYFSTVILSENYNAHYIIELSYIKCVIKNEITLDDVKLFNVSKSNISKSQQKS